MNSCNLTKSAIDTLPSSTKDVLLWDKELKGFALKITPEVGRSFWSSTALPVIAGIPVSTRSASTAR